MELEESVFAPEILYKISFYPLKRPKDNHKLKTTPLELRNLTISRNHSHQSKLSLSFGDKKKKKLIPGNVQDIPGSVRDESGLSCHTR